MQLSRDRVESKVPAFKLCAPIELQDVLFNVIGAPARARYGIAFAPGRESISIALQECSAAP